MKNSITILSSLLLLILTVACGNPESLQQYYVDQAENPDFISFDIPASILNVSDADLTESQKAAYESLKKFNVLAFKLDGDNQAEFEGEKARVDKILKGDSYQELMRINTSDYKGVVKYQGDEETIDELILFGSSQDMGFALVRVLGEDMRPEYMMELMQVLQKGDLDEAGLESLKGLFSGS